MQLADDEERIRYRIGDAFVLLPVENVRSRLETQNQAIADENAVLEKDAVVLRNEMDSLKKSLYSRFGTSINLERD